MSKAVFLCLMLVAATMASQTAMLMQAKEAKVTDHQTKVNPDGSKTHIYFAQHKDGVSGKAIYYKKTVNGNNVSVYFRYDPNSQWRLLPKGCPAPEIKPKEGNDKCEMGWKVGKVMATTAVYLGSKKGAEEAQVTNTKAGKPSTHKGSVADVAKAVDRKLIEQTNKAIAAAAAKIANNLQNCVKRTITKTGFTVKKVCMHKGLVAESDALINSLKEHGADPAYNCDYATLRDKSKCVPTHSK